jgi:hypothetical protein
MTGRSPLKFDADTDETVFDLFKSLFLLVLAAGLLRTFNRETLLTASYTMRPSDPTLVGTVVYAGVGLVVLGAVVGVRRQRRPPEQRRSRRALAGSTGAAAAGLLTCAYVLHRGLNLPVFPRELLL